MARVNYFQRHIEWAGHFLLTPLRKIVEWQMEKRKWVFLYRVWGSGIGDSLAISTILAHLHQTRGVKGIVFSKRAELFYGNSQVILNIDHRRMPKLARSLLGSAAKYLRGKSVLCVGGNDWAVGSKPWHPPRGHDLYLPYLADMIRDKQAQAIDLTNAAPHIEFTAEEHAAFAHKFSTLPERFCVVKATAGLDRIRGMGLKNWDIEKMQHVVLTSQAEHGLAWVQIGEVGEPELAGAIPVLGKTSIRETLYLLSKAQLCLTVEGFISHAAAAFECPVVVIFSGWHDHRILLYPHTVPIYAQPQPACAPCRLDECTTPGKPCTSTIPTSAVLHSMYTALGLQLHNKTK